MLDVVASSEKIYLLKVGEGRKGRSMRIGFVPLDYNGLDSRTDRIACDLESVLCSLGCREGFWWWAWGCERVFCC